MDSDHYNIAINVQKSREWIDLFLLKTNMNWSFADVSEVCEIYLSTHNSLTSQNVRMLGIVHLEDEFWVHYGIVMGKRILPVPEHCQWFL